MDVISRRMMMGRVLAQMAQSESIGQIINITTATNNSKAFVETYLTNVKPNRIYSIVAVSFASTMINNQIIGLQIKTDSNGTISGLDSYGGMRLRNNQYTTFSYGTAYDAKTSVGDKYCVIESEEITF